MSRTPSPATSRQRRLSLERCNFGICAFGRTCVQGFGPMPAKVMLVGEAPGQRELREGRPFVGPAGKLLDELMEEAGLRRAEVYITNTCGCVDMEREDRRPLPAELEACRPRLLAEIELCAPQVILLAGNTALQAFMPGFRIGEVAGSWRGIDGRIVIPMYHPSHVLRGARQVRPVIVEALRQARRLTA